MKIFNSDVILGIVVIAGAAVYLWADSRLPVAAMADPLGPKAFPVLVGCGLILSGLILLAEGRKKYRTASGTTHRRRVDMRQVATLCGMLVWTVLYYATFDSVGYLIGTPIFIFGLLCHFHRGKHLVNGLIAIGFTAVAYALFSLLLHVPLPTGPIPI
jgi:putative tricarboxylic transport membrane protein